MQRQSVEQSNCESDEVDSVGDRSTGRGGRSKKKGSWFKSIKHSVKGYREKPSGDDPSSAMDDSQDIWFHGPATVRVRQYRKSSQDLMALCKCQAIWTIKFSFDGRHLASAGEDRQVVESDWEGRFFMEKLEDENRNSFFVVNGSSESASVFSNIDNHLEKKRRGRSLDSLKSKDGSRIYAP